MGYEDQQGISAIGRVRYTDASDISRTYQTSQISMPNFDNRTFNMANVAMKVNDAMGESKGMDGIIKNYDIIQDYNQGGMSRFFGYNAPQEVSYYNIA